MTTGEKIRKIRKERGMTQEELGAAIGVQKAAINKYETGIVVNLKREIIGKLAKALDVSPVWLMDENDELQDHFSIKNSKELVKLITAMTPEDYTMVMAAIDRTYKRLKAEGKM